MHIFSEEKFEMMLAIARHLRCSQNPLPDRYSIKALYLNEFEILLRFEGLYRNVTWETIKFIYLSNKKKIHASPRSIGFSIKIFHCSFPTQFWRHSGLSAESLRCALFQIKNIHLKQFTGERCLMYFRNVIITLL